MRYARFRQKRRAKGQAIVEYATVIAFVCCLIALAFQISRGGLFGGISNAYSTANSSLDQLNQAAVDQGH